LIAERADEAGSATSPVAVEAAPRHVEVRRVRRRTSESSGHESTDAAVAAAVHATTSTTSRSDDCPLIISGVATQWTAVEMSTPLLLEVAPEIDTNPTSFFLQGEG